MSNQDLLTQDARELARNLIYESVTWDSEPASEPAKNGKRIHSLMVLPPAFQALSDAPPHNAKAVPLATSMPRPASSPG